MTPSMLNEFQESYLAGLRTHVTQNDHEESMKVAHQLGTRALGLGLETLDLASIHRQVLSILESDEVPTLEVGAMTKLAEHFFDVMLLPIEASHETAIEARSQLESLNAELARITREMDETTRELELGIKRRKSAEQELRAEGEISAKLLSESRQLYSQVREMARKIMVATEKERRSLSRQLQDEIAQALVGLQVRLQVLRGEVTSSSENVRKEIELTHRLVRKSVGAINDILLSFEVANES